ncbi:MAG TPA: methylmalonyl Co-A mutase-associated GTPase MeaB [Mycobacteriales bacterium]|nr:methylmalonyl Co-A mutase-associated GTPase MeaB [Mycobacteriales bacterium]HWA66436.1 methylmalonyl Co-A mutase-associated GTPase MeaB [Mycobacteriales bacterium]
MSVDVDGLVARAREGDHRSVARLITLVENAAPELREVMAALVPSSGNARLLGITGSPGVGKSTTTSELLAAYRRRGERVGVLAIDPTSPFSGGALLGDRVRMQDHATDAGVYIRSMGTRGHLGGLSWATPQAVRVLDAVGCDVVIVETVGVGQAEVDIAALADTTVVMLAPGLGDGIQAAKAGILEIADVLVVNKADRDGATQTVRDLKAMLALAGTPAPGDWRPPVLSTVSVKSENIDQLVEELDRHRDWLGASGQLEVRRQRRVVEEIEGLAVAAMRNRIAELRGGALVTDLAAEVLRGTTDPYAAADRLVAAVDR